MSDLKDPQHMTLREAQDAVGRLRAAIRDNKGKYLRIQDAARRERDGRARAERKCRELEEHIAALERQVAALKAATPRTGLFGSPFGGFDVN